MTCRRWSQWSDTRWARFGRSARLFVRSLATGIDAAVQAYFDDDSCSNYLLTGYRRASPEVRMLVAAAAFAVTPFQDFILEMLSDDRLLRRSEELHGRVLERMAGVFQMGPLVWERVAALIGATVEDVRHQVFLTMLVSYGSLYRGVFRDLKFEPLSLTQGDAAGNVADLLARDPSTIDDGLTKRIHAMLVAGIPEASVIDALMLMRDAPTSTALVEQGHASAAVMMRSHERYSEKALRVRALLHSLRPCVRLERVDRRVALIDRKSSRLAAMRPGRVNGRHMFLKHQIEDSLTSMPQDPAARLEESRRRMSAHEHEFRALTPLERVPFERKAIEHVEQCKLDIAEVQARLLNERRRLEREARGRKEAEDVPNSVNEARLRDDELQRACDFFDSPVGTKLRLEPHLGAWGKAPEAPIAGEQRVIRGVATGEEGLGIAGHRRWWLSHVCRARELFFATALGLEADGDEYWMLLFAKQAPFQATFLQLRRRPVVLDISCQSVVAQITPPPDRREYECFPPVVRTEADLPFPFEDCDIFVRSGLRLGAGGVGAPHSPLLLERFLLQCPPVVSKRAGGQPSKRRQKVASSQRAALLEEFPWLSDGDLERERPAARKQVKAVATAKVPAEGVQKPEAQVAPAGLVGEIVAHEEPVDPELPALYEVDGAMEELAAVREELAWDEDPLFFYTRPLGGGGGGWTKQNKGLPQMDVQAFVVGASRWLGVCASGSRSRRRSCSRSSGSSRRRS